MSTLFSWLIGSYYGRRVFFILAAVGSLVLAFYSATLIGRRAEQAKQLEYHIKILANQVRANDEISNLNDNARRAYIRKWLRVD